MKSTTLRGKLAALAALDRADFRRDVLLTWTSREITLRSILLIAEIVEDFARAGIGTRAFDHGLGLAIFRDKSTRTRYAFRAACNLLGLMTEELDESTSQVSHGETVRETATMIGFLSQVLGIRDDMVLGEGHAYMSEVAASLDESHQAGILLQRPSVINLQSDLDHPTQTLADLRHLTNVFGGLDALRGKKLVMSWAYSPTYAKPLSVPQGVIALMCRFGMQVVLAHPPGYELVHETLVAATRGAQDSGGSFEITDSMDEAFVDADVVYPKSWAPMRVMTERARLVRSGARGELAELERQALAENAQFKHWECTDALMRRTRNRSALYMHCLPADITGITCAAGEVAQDVFERARLDTYREASHKPFVIAAMILNQRVADPAVLLTKCLQEGRPASWKTSSSSPSAATR